MTCASKLKHLCILIAGLLGSTLHAGETAMAVSGLDERGQFEVVLARADKGFSYRRLECGIQFCVAGVFKNVLFYGPEMVRVNANLGQPHTIQQSLVVVTSPAKVPFKVKESAAALTIISDKLRVLVDDSPAR